MWPGANCRLVGRTWISAGRDRPERLITPTAPGPSPPRGKDICSSDQLHFAWRPTSADGRIVARVESVSNTASGQAGVMFRNDTATGSIEAAVLATVNNGVTFQWRSTAGSGCSYQIALGVASPATPFWVSLVRAGNSFSGFWSTNGVDCNQVGTVQTVAISQAALAGLAASANDSTNLCTATFTR